MIAFWDSSALLPLLVDEPSSERMRQILSAQSGLVTWWGTAIECHSALQRRLREGGLNPATWAQAVARLDLLNRIAYEVAPSQAVRRLATQLLARHPLRAADATQLAASLSWTREKPAGRTFVCLDQRLSQAALLEGFQVRC